MAFEKASREWPCYICGTPYKWFKMMVSDNPGTHIVDEEGAGEIQPRGEKDEGIVLPEGRAMRVCRDCEFQYRQRAQHTHPVGKHDPEWALMKTINRDMKQANKGEQYVQRGAHYKAACRIVEAAESWKTMSKRQKAEAKTEMSYKLAAQFLKVIKNGKLFSAFSRAAVRIKLSESFDRQVNQLYEEYLLDPENEDKLRKLEEIEGEVALELDYKTAGGDTKILKELDHHNDLDADCGIFQFDLCRRGVATQSLRQPCKPPNHIATYYYLLQHYNYEKNN